MKMKFEAYEAWKNHNRRRNELIRDNRAAIAEAKAKREELEQEYTTQIVDGVNTTTIERALDKSDKEIERHERILENLKNYVDDGLEEELTRKALDEFGESLEHIDEEMQKVLDDIEAANEKIWDMIEDYLDVRQEAKRVLQVRESVLSSVAEKEFAPRVKDIGNPGRMERLNPTSIPLITIGAIRERFGRKAR